MTENPYSTSTIDIGLQVENRLLKAINDTTRKISLITVSGAGEEKLLDESARLLEQAFSFYCVNFISGEELRSYEQFASSLDNPEENTLSNSIKLNIAAALLKGERTLTPGLAIVPASFTPTFETESADDDYFGLNNQVTVAVAVIEYDQSSVLSQTELVALENILQILACNLQSAPTFEHDRAYVPTRVMQRHRFPPRHSHSGENIPPNNDCIATAIFDVAGWSEILSGNQPANGNGDENLIKHQPTPTQIAVKILDIYRAIAEGHADEHNGTISYSGGDEIIMTFKLASTAVAAAFSIQQQFLIQHLPGPYEFRCGVAYGPGMDIISKLPKSIIYSSYGKCLNLAKRIETGGKAPGQVIISTETKAAIEMEIRQGDSQYSFTFTYKGMAKVKDKEPELELWEVTSVTDLTEALLKLHVPGTRQ